jgi:protein phosphatase
MLEAYGVSHVGLVRKTNEDAYLSDPDLGLFCVADGMGGHNAGEVASRIAVDVIRDFVRRTTSQNEVTWPYGLDVQLSFDGNRLATAVKLANQQVFADAGQRADYSGMGTTVVAVLVRDRIMTYVGVGDSRIYSFRHGRLSQLTHDDSWVATVLDQDGQMSEAALASHPMRHVLTSVVGVREELAVDVVERELPEDDLLLMSSDGLHGMLSDASIADALAAGPTLEDAARRLIDEALDNGGTDNLTALLVRRRG